MPALYGYLALSFAIGALMTCIGLYLMTRARDRRIIRMCNQVLEAQNKGHLMTVIEGGADREPDRAS